MTGLWRTFYYDGHSVIADLKTLPLVYRFEITGKFTEKVKYQITLYFPLNTEHYPTQNNIEKLTITLNQRTGIWLDLYDLKPLDDMADIKCADTVLCFQKFKISGDVVFNIRNQKENKTVFLVSKPLPTRGICIRRNILFFRIANKNISF